MTAFVLVVLPLLCVCLTLYDTRVVSMHKHDLPLKELKQLDGLRARVPHLVEALARVDLPRALVKCNC
jgi:hypothetical protein